MEKYNLRFMVPMICIHRKQRHKKKNKGRDQQINNTATTDNKIAFARKGKDYEKARKWAS